MEQPVRRRAALTTESAVAAAIGLADEDGIDALSMRSLAARLGMSPMALYRHVAGKDELLDAMVDAVVAGYATSDTTGQWRTVVTARIFAARDALAAHPWLRRLIETRTTRTPHVLAHMDFLSGALIAGGFSVDLAHHAMHALGYRIWGLSPEAFTSTDPTPVPVDPAQQQAMLRAAAHVYPNIVAITLDVAEHNPSGACDEAFEFEFTLDLLLDAFERLRDAGWSSRTR